MPNLFLDPIAENDATGKPTGKVTDPAADVDGVPAERADRLAAGAAVARPPS